MNLCHLLFLAVVVMSVVDVMTGPGGVVVTVKTAALVFGAGSGAEPPSLVFVVDDSACCACEVEKSKVAVTVCVAVAVHEPPMTALSTSELGDWPLM